MSRSRGRRSGPESGPDAAEDVEADPEEVARQIVLRKLAVQARSREELTRALRDKRVPEEAAEAVLDRFTELGLVDDAQFARDWVESRQARRGLSRRALRQELTSKGIDRDQIEEALEPLGTADELAAARQLAEKKVRSLGSVERAVRYRRVAGALSRRGFGAGVIATVLDEVVDDRDAAGGRGGAESGRSESGSEGVGVLDRA